MRLVLRRAEVGDKQIVLELHGSECSRIAQTPEMATAQSLQRSEPPDWLPGLVPQSVLRDVVTVRLPSLFRWARSQRDSLRRVESDFQATWQTIVDSGAVNNRADLARRLGLSRARVTQVLGTMS